MAESEAQAAYRKLVNDMANEKTTDIADIGDILERAAAPSSSFRKTSRIGVSS